MTILPPGFLPKVAVHDLGSAKPMEVPLANVVHVAPAGSVAVDALHAPLEPSTLDGGAGTALAFPGAFQRDLHGTRTLPVNEERAARYHAAVSTLRAKGASPAGYQAPVGAKYDTAAELDAIGRAFAGEQNAWSVFAELSTPELLSAELETQRRINPNDPASAARNTVESVKDVLEMLAHRSDFVQGLSGRVSPHLNDLNWSYADRMGTPDAQTPGRLDNFKPALEHLGSSSGTKLLVSRDLWSRVGQKSFFQDLSSIVRGRSPLAGLRMKGVALAPPYESPGLDVYYDPSGPGIREELGGEAGFLKMRDQLLQPRRAKQFLDRLRGRNPEAAQLMLDFLGGHLSEQSPQFRAMLSGDLEARKFFNVLPPEVKVAGFEDHDGKPHVLLQMPNGGVLSAWRIFGHASESNFRVDYIPVQDPAVVNPAAVLDLAKSAAVLKSFRTGGTTDDLAALRNYRMSPEWDTRYRYVNVGGKLHEIVPTFHWFYDHQPSLNHRYEGTQHLMHEVLAKDLERGVSIFRADAAPHWGFRFPEANEKLNLSDINEHMALQAHYKWVLMHVAPYAKLIPEVSTSIGEAARYYGDVIEGPDGVATTRMADALLDFDSHRAFWESVLDMDATPLVAHEQELDALGLDPKLEGLLRFMEHHDEIITQGFKNRDTIDAGLRANGMADFNDRGFGGRITDALAFNTKRIAMTRVLKRAVTGATMDHYGSMEGSRNDPEVVARTATMRQSVAARFGRYLSPEAAYDGRDLARNFVSKGRLRRSRVSRREEIRAVRSVNRLGEKSATLRSAPGNVLDGGNARTFSVARQDATGKEASRLWLFNLHDHPQEISLSRQVLEDSLGWKQLPHGSFEDILAKDMEDRHRAVPKNFVVDGDAVRFKLDPFEYHILENPADAARDSHKLRWGSRPQ